MNIVYICTTAGQPIRTYPDAYVAISDGFTYVFDTNLNGPDCDFSYTGTWLACCSGSIITIEEHQTEDSPCT